MFPLGCNAIPMMTLAPPVVGAGKPWPPFVPLPEAAAGVGPLWKGEAPRDAGAERRRTLMARWSSLFRTAGVTITCIGCAGTLGSGDVLLAQIQQWPKRLNLD
jgi:hypothetical protein